MGLVLQPKNSIYSCSLLNFKCEILGKDRKGEEKWVNILEQMVSVGKQM